MPTPRYHPPWLRAALSLVRGRFYSARRPFFRRLGGDFPVVHTPGLPPSPGLSRLRAAVLVPVFALRIEDTPDFQPDSNGSIGQQCALPVAVWVVTT